jgi:hypothetical protein
MPVYLLLLHGPGIRSDTCKAANMVSHADTGLHPRASMRPTLPLNPWFRAMMSGEHHIRGLSNADIRTCLEGSSHLRDLVSYSKKQSAKVSRILNRFHAHKLIAKIPRSRRKTLSTFSLPCVIPLSRAATLPITKENHIKLAEKLYETDLGYCRHPTDGRCFAGRTVQPARKQ